MVRVSWGAGGGLTMVEADASRGAGGGGTTVEAGASWAISLREGGGDGRDTGEACEAAAG